MRLTARAMLLVVVPCAIAAPRAGAQVTPFQAAKARALLEERLPCLGCHALGDAGGRIAPDLATVGARRTAGTIAAIVTDPRTALPGAAMPHTPMPATTRTLIIAYLSRGAAGGTASPAAAATVPEPTDGPGLYARWCASCHGAAGQGDGPNARHLPAPPAVHTDATTLGARSDDQLFDAIAAGGEAMGKSPRMPAFGTTLTSAQLRLLVTHLRRLCDCAGPAWARTP